MNERKGFVDTFNEEMSKQTPERQDEIFDSIAKTLKEAGHPHCSIKAMRRINDQGTYNGVVKCKACEKHFTVEEWPEDKPCPNCKTT